MASIEVDALWTDLLFSSLSFLFQTARRGRYERGCFIKTASVGERRTKLASTAAAPFLKGEADRFFLLKIVKGQKLSTKTI